MSVCAHEMRVTFGCSLQIELSERGLTRIHGLSERQQLIFREISFADRVGFWGNLSEGIDSAWATRWIGLE